METVMETASMTYNELVAEIANLRIKAEAARKEEVASVVKDIKESIQAYGITAADLGFNSAGKVEAKKATKPAAIKFRGPNGETWCNRGQMPKWLAALVAQGHKAEEYAV